MSNLRRLKTIELTLTPHQIVLLWLKNAVRWTFQAGARQDVSPRVVVANKVAATVRNSLKGQSEKLVQRVLVQAREEADSLYNIVIAVNVAVQNGFLQSNREYLFLSRYLTAVMRSGVGSDVGSESEEEVRTLTLAFVEEPLLLEAAISQIARKCFDGQPLLFLDSAQLLKQQLDLADRVLLDFNLLAQRSDFTEMNLEGIRNKLQPEVDQQVFRWESMGRLEMLATLGDEKGLLAALDQLISQRPE